MACFTIMIYDKYANALFIRSQECMTDLLFKWPLRLECSFEWVLHIVHSLMVMVCHAIPDSKVHGANMGPIWGRQDPGGPHAGSMNFAIWDMFGGINAQWITRNMHIVCTLLCLLWLGIDQFYPFSSGLLHWHWGNHMIAPVSVK